MTMKSIIEKLGFDPFDSNQNPQKPQPWVIDDTWSPYDVLTDEEMHFLAQEAIRTMKK